MKRRKGESRLFSYINRNYSLAPMNLPQESGHGVATAGIYMILYIYEYCQMTK
jgi:hypothetical protein